MRQLPKLLGRLLAATAVVVIVGLSTSPARAQYSGDYFDPYRAAYRTSSLPIDTQIVPGQRRVVTPPGLGTVPGIGTPSDISFSNPTGRESPYGMTDRFGLDIYDPIGDVYRQYDEQFGRVYRPNAESDGQFFEEQDERRQLYLEAMRETDPQRRAELVRQFREFSRRVSLGMAPSASRNALNSTARREDSATPARGTGGTAAVPETVRSYDDLLRWSRVVNRQALRAGVVRPGSN